LKFSLDGIPRLAAAGDLDMLKCALFSSN